MRLRPSPMGSATPQSANTRRVYQTAWHLFCEWTLLTGRQSMPAEPQTVALYLGHLAADGKAIASIAQARDAISHAHAAQGIPKGDNPARHPIVAETIKGWRNQALAPRQVDALTADALARIRETARLPRRGRGSRTETTAMAQARGTVDLAIIGVMADAGLRWSEAAALTWSDIESGPTAQPASPSARARTSRSRRQWPSPRPPPAPCETFSQMTPTPPRHSSA